MQETLFAEIVRKYQKQLLVIAIHICQNQYDAEDMVQEAFLKLYAKNPRFQSEAHLRSWLIRVTVNRCRDLLRSPVRKHLSLIEEDAILTQPDETALAVSEAVRSLPEKYREVVILYYYADCSTAEIAKLLHRRTGTVQVQLTRARELLKDRLKEVWEDEST
ncbi:MAG: sigma-70 family RNA polymerase sigma factor [Oscillospiraceae bacterium]|nr:sigma-70 family RNA polymerase sigma factor [Oscillospiraceae bacterium]